MQDDVAYIVPRLALEIRASSLSLSYINDRNLIFLFLLKCTVTHFTQLVISPTAPINLLRRDAPVLVGHRAEEFCCEPRSSQPLFAVLPRVPPTLTISALLPTSLLYSHQHDEYLHFPARNIIPGTTGFQLVKNSCSNGGSGGKVALWNSPYSYSASATQTSSSIVTLTGMETLHRAIPIQGAMPSTWTTYLSHHGPYLCLILLPIAYVFYQLFLSPLASIPGPLPARLSRLWLLHQSRSGRLHRTMISLHARYGKLIRTAPNEVSISDVNVIKKIYSAGTKFRKSDWYSVWQGTRKFDLFPERDEGVHGRQRRLVNGIYSMGSISGYQGKVDEAIDVFVREIEKRVGTVMDLGNWLQLFAFDVVGGLTFSKRFGFLEAGEDDGSFGNIESALFSASWVGQMPWIYWLNDFFTPFLGNWLGIAARHGKIRQFAAAQVAEQNGKTHGSDFLSDLKKVHEQKPDEMNDMAVLSMATSNIFAGSDTTAISLRSIIYYLLKNLDMKKRLLEEIDDRVRQGKLSDPATLEEANEMPYLQACMYEALRLHPAVGMSLPRVVPEGGIEIDRHYLPAGTIIGANPWVVHRDQCIFGEDIEAFRPGRWLKGDRSDMDRFFFAFGSGARMCLGRNISWMEMSKLIPTLFGKFELELADQEADWKETCMWFVKQEGLLVKLRPRQKR